MKFLSKKLLLTAVTTLLLGIIIGSQIPSLVERYNLWQGEKRAFKQLENSVNKADSWVLISQYRYRRGDEEGSIEAAHKALELDSHHVIALEKIAFNYLEMGDLENSKIWLEKALKEAEIYAPGQVEILKLALTQVKNQMKP